MEHAYTQLMHLLSGHPTSALVAIFLAAFLEAVAVIGTFIPGSTVMFLGGALIGTGSLHLGWSLAVAIAGAVGGDALSYWLGSRFKDTITQMWPFHTHPKMLEKGHAFFIKHGAKSIAFARFIGPMRAVVPVVAGMFGMQPARFYAINIASALLWAVAHLLPGAVFGASLQMAGAVSFRLVVILTILVGLVWITLRVTRALLRRAMNWTSLARLRLSAWASPNTGFARPLTLRLLRFDRTALAVAMSASAVVLLCAGVFFRVFRDVISAAPFLQFDVSVYRFMQSVRNPWSDAVLASFTALNSIPTLLALTATAACWMAWENRWRALVSWLGAVAISEMVVLAIQFTVHRVPPGSLPTETYILASSQVSASVVVYGFIGFFIVRRVSTLIGFLVAMTSAAVVAVSALAGLYFARFWMSDAIAEAALALAWVAIIGVIAVWHRPSVPASRGLLPVVFMLVAACSVGLQLDGERPRQLDTSRPRAVSMLGTEKQWAEYRWKRLPCYRADMVGDRQEPFVVQWAAGRDDMTRQLHAMGWMDSPALSIRSVLMLAIPNAAAADLPVLRRLDNGVPSPMMFVRPGASPRDRNVLRLWETGQEIADSKGMSLPVWVGSFAHERMRASSWPFNLLRGDTPERYESSPFSLSEHAIAAVSCHGTALTLMSSMHP